MTFDDILEQVIIILKRQGRVSYGAIKRRFNLDDAYLEDLKGEILYVHPVVDDEGKGLIWTGETEAVASQPAPASVSQPIQQDQPTQAESPSPEPPIPEAERRQLTVMFCDLADSTRLSGQLDPEDLRDVIRAYQSTSAEVIERYDGYIAQHLGDGLMVYFGWPQAHEDDAQRAVHAGLSILGAMRGLNARLEKEKGIRLAVRIGVHTGLVVVGEMGHGARQEHLALGETPNIASRIEGIAEPDTVAVSAATYQLVQGYFVCEELGQQMLRGVDDAQQVHRVVRETDVQSRFDVAAIRGLTPLVGRESESALLFDRWQQAKDGQGQVVLLSGEAGIGKSRLLQVLRGHVADEPHLRLECRSSPYYQNTAFYPITDLLQRTLQFQAGDTSEQRLEKLEQELSQYRLSLEESVPLLAPLLSLPVPEDRYPTMQWSAQRQRQKTLESIVAILLQQAEQQPVLFILEDLHWTDPSTLELLDLLIGQVPTTAICVLLTGRPAFQPLWSGRSYLSQVTLNRLSHNQIKHMAEQVAGGKHLPDEVLHQIIDKTDGVPLFVEEMTKAVLESGLLKEVDDRYDLAGTFSSLAIPSTLQDSLMARLDRLMTAKVIAQLGATIGRQFSYGLLQAISQLDEPTLQRELRRLVKAELVYQRGLPPQAAYTFKHALIQETAYESLLCSTRQGYHRRIAEVLEERFPETVTTQPELLAHHYAQAGLNEQAVAYGLRAGEEARKSYARVEAVDYLTTALERLAILPDTPERARQELSVQLTLAPVLASLKGYAAPETERTYVRARDLCEHVGETALPYLSVLRGLSRAYIVGGDLRQGRAVGEAFMRLAQDKDDPAPRLSAHRTLGDILLRCGELSQARQHLEQSLVGTERIPQRQLEQFAVLPEVGFGLLAETLWVLGYADQALERSQAALTLASNDIGLANALHSAGLVRLLRRETRSAWELSEKTVALTTERGLAQQLARGIMERGIAWSRQGHHDEGLVQIENGMAAYLETGASSRLTWFLGCLAEAYGRTGRFEEAQSTLTEAISRANKSGECVFKAELYRFQGEILLQQTTPDERQAETCLHQALDVARQQQAKSWELRAATSLARLWQSQGKYQAAYDLLEPVCAWFTEGFDTADLKDTKALLDELA